MTTSTSKNTSPTEFSLLEESAECLSISLTGVLSAQTIGSIWTELMSKMDKLTPMRVDVDASAVTYCDGAGIGLFIEFSRRQVARKGSFKVKGLPKDAEANLASLTTGQPLEIAQEPDVSSDIVSQIGKSSVAVFQDLYVQISFIGELLWHMFVALRHPKRNIRWHDVWYVVNKDGIGAIPIIILINFLMGLIMAFQGSIPMKMFGAEVYIADLTGLSILRVLGPLMTAIVLTGRTGSAFAAELGTMKVNEEINALTTMGINPMRFLVVNRVLGVIILLPILALIGNLAGLIGGAVVYKSLGFPLVTYINQILLSVKLSDFMSGFVKTFVFAAIIGGVGCMRGLETKNGSTAVGESATRAVVTGLVLLIIFEGLFAVLYYILGI